MSPAATDVSPELPGVKGMVVVDTETTGLPWSAPVWEVAAITPDGTEHVWHLPINVGHVDPWVMEHCRFAERYQLDNLTPLEQFRGEFAALFGWPYSPVPGAVVGDDPPMEERLHMAGNVVSFDAHHLGLLWHGIGHEVPWHYHLVDAEPMAVGYLLGQGRPMPALPWDSRDISQRLGVAVPDGLHDALVDARWCRDLLRACGA